MRFLPPTPPPRHKPIEDMASVIASLDCKTPESNHSAPSTPGAFAGDPCFFSRGAHTFRVPSTLHEDNRKRAIALLKDHPPGIIVLVGGVARTRNDSDHEELFRQESYFQHLFGVKEPGWVGCLEVPSGTCTLFAPELPQSYAVWMGKIATRSELSNRYGVKVKWLSELQDHCAKQKCYVPRGRNSDSGKRIDEALPLPVELPTLVHSTTIPNHCFVALAECRVIKSPDERKLLRYASWVSSNAHAEVMREAKAGIMEYQLEARFLYHCASQGGCRSCAYTSICACGPNSAVLHYGHAGAPNDRRLETGDLALLDMGAEYHCYCSDLTCTMPVGGKFGPSQRIVYEGVLSAQRAVFAMLKPGVSWTDCHLAAENEVLKSLEVLGVLKKGCVTEAQRACVGGVFLPCGLGHFIGLDTHDVGGYLPGQPKRSERPGLAKLRTARTLKQGMCLTVEPGCYFIDALLDDALKDPSLSKFLNADRLRGFRGFGGVRLEDVVCITSNGFENFTTCPRTINEVQAVMSGGVWPPPVDEAPDLQRRWARFADGALEDVSVPGIVLPKGARRGSFSPGGSPGTRRGSGSLIGRVRASSGSFSGREDY